MALALPPWSASVGSTSVESRQCLPAAVTREPSTPWAQALLRPQRVWPLTRGTGVTVAVVDTGVDGTTPQLTGRVTGDGTDCAGHGTFVAGIVAAAPADGVGFVGMAPGARILSLAVTQNAADRTPQAQVAAAIRTAAGQGAKVILVAVPVHRSGDELRDAVIAADAADCLVVLGAIAGKDGDPPLDPKLLELALSVGGIDADGGVLSDSAAPADLLAPGASIVSVGPGGPGHLTAGGTGYAVPFVAGAAALVRAYDPALTARQVKQRLTVTAGIAGGLLDPYAAVTAILPAERGDATPPGSAPPALIAVPTVRDDAASSIAWTVVLIAGAALTGGGCLALLLPRGRRRLWRAAPR